MVATFSLLRPIGYIIYQRNPVVNSLLRISPYLFAKVFLVGTTLRFLFAEGERIGDEFSCAKENLIFVQTAQKENFLNEQNAG